MNKEQQSRFLALYAMVMADGIVAVEELETLYRIGREDYGLSQEEINNYVLSSGTSFIIPEKFSDCIKILYEMAQIAWADKDIDATEKQLIRRYAMRMGFKEENAEEICDWLLEQAEKETPFEDVIKQIK